jgi:hypothetical protein
MAAAAQAFATFALAEVTAEQADHLRLLAGWIDTLTGALGTGLGHIGDQVEGIRYKP